MEGGHRSEIRHNEIKELLEKVRAGNYDKYLRRIRLTKVRGFVDRTVELDFPVTALVGPNGGGKTTILGAAAIVYESVRPRQFFAKSGKYDGSMQSWRIEYELHDKSINARTTVSRTASYRQQKWNREALRRDVLIFGVARTVPASERAEMQRCISGTFSVPERCALRRPTCADLRAAGQCRRVVWVADRS